MCASCVRGFESESGFSERLGRLVCFGVSILLPSTPYISAYTYHATYSVLWEYLEAGISYMADGRKWREMRVMFFLRQPS